MSPVFLMVQNINERYQRYFWESNSIWTRNTEHGEMVEIEVAKAVVLFR